MLAFYLDLHNGAEIFLKPHLIFCVLTILIFESSKIRCVTDKHGRSNERAGKEGSCFIKRYPNFKIVTPYHSGTSIV